MEQVAAGKQRDREMWAAGDYDAIAARIWDVGELLVGRLGVAAGDEALDVACGTGNVAVRAAQAGARVTGLDLTAELFDAARGHATAAGVDVAWVQGDAEALPFEDGSFDVVTSSFGCMFAPRHEAVAAELARVLRSGGRLGLCNWTPEGFVGDFFRTIGRHAPPPPDAGPPPLLWGTEDHCRDLFAGRGLELQFDREVTHLRWRSVEEGVEEYATKFGPVVKARERIEPQGGWPALHDDLVALLERHNTAVAGAAEVAAEYLVVRGRQVG